MKATIKISIIGIVLTMCVSCCVTSNNYDKNSFDNEVISTAKLQLGHQLKTVNELEKGHYPWTSYNGEIIYTSKTGWTSGFFPGTILYMYDITGEQYWLDEGVAMTESLDSAKYLTRHHDVGFIINSSFGNALKYTGNSDYESVVVEAARSLASRYRPKAGIIQSWNSRKDWKCPVIIDNMMNLELLFKATQYSKDSTFHKIAISHADKTLENHFRKDGSSYHVVDYDTITGAIVNRHTSQGFAHESAWARGQAWALYGYVMCYRFTGYQRYLDQALKVYNYIFNHPNMPNDLVPYWDFDAPMIPNEPRDVSAAAIIASALYELSEQGVTECKSKADQIIETLSSPAYLAIVGTNGNFLLMHSTGSIPHSKEIDAPLNYADYYFLEALIRKREIEEVLN